MCAEKMHGDELETDVALVRRLLAGQFPRWAGLAIERVASAGTENAIYRLGEEMAVRLPRRPGKSGGVDKECRWLPYLAPHLPLAVPVPLGKGTPADGYPSNWSVCTWLEGDDATIERPADPVQAAADLAAFVAALQGIDATGGPTPGEHNFGRGVPLATRDAYTRGAIAKLEGVLDIEAVTAAWEADMRAPAWERAPVWVHGDLKPANLLVEQGRLSAVIDFGGLGVGDPACELIVAWSLFSGEGRDAFRAAQGVDDATWTRGRGWALSVALLELPYYVDTNPAMVMEARHVIREVLADHARGA